MSLFDSIRRLFGGKARPEQRRSAPRSAPPSPPPAEPAERADFWSRLGRTSRGDDGFLTVVRRDSTLYGLGDPGGVLVIETDPGEHGWPRPLLEEAARQLEDTDMRGIFEHFGMTVVELRGASGRPAVAAIGESFIGADDTIGALVGKPVPDFGEDADGVRVIPVVLLTAAELAEVRAGDLETAAVIVERLGSHRSSLTRASVV